MRLNGSKVHDEAMELDIQPVYIGWGGASRIFSQSGSCDLSPRRRSIEAGHIFCRRINTAGRRYSVLYGQVRVDLVRVRCRVQGKAMLNLFTFYIISVSGS